MNNREEWTNRFLIYTKEMELFIEYCKKFEVIQDTKITFTLTAKMIDNDGSFIWNDAFVADVTFHNELDSLRFMNVFKLFFKLSTYCSRI